MNKASVKTTLGFASLASVSLMALIGCAQPSNPERMAPPATVSIASDSKPIETTAVFQPKVDILFVIDNSDSMKDHQEKLKSNIDRFVEAFKSNARVDFQIGVVSVFDSQRYGPVVKDFHPLGVMYPVKRADGSSGNGLNFVTRQDPDFTKTLGETLKIGTIARLGPKGEDLGGPEYEEAFTPVKAALDGRNVGFPRADAHLAVIMITDADDVSSIEAPTLKADLVRMKGNDASMVSTFGVLALTCSKVDPGIKGTGPVKIKAFVNAAPKGEIYDLCSKSYGDKLAEAGRLIEKKATKTLRIPLEAPPANDAKGNTTLKVVFYEAKGAIDAEERSRVCDNGVNQLGKGRVYYNAKTQQVVVAGSAMEGKPASTTIQICYEKADMSKAGSTWLQGESTLKAK
ncbi:MAG: hypothetical protein EOP05_16580 [Proteobacteria bacterium]|nr:MAG: hypothetical protein EOP05_16580 [Pseudomonadota bacterium]